MNEIPPVNPVALERLQRLGGKPFVLEMLRLFLSYGAKKVAEARQAQTAGNLRALADAVHPLKSSAGNVGAARVQALAEQVEQYAQEQNTDLAHSRLDDLERAFAEAASLLEVEQKRLSGSES